MAKTNKNSAVKTSVNERELAEAKLKAIEEQEIKTCTEEFNKVVEPILKKYGCRLVIQGQFAGNQIAAGLTIVKAK